MLLSKEMETYVEDCDRDVLVLKKNLRARNDSLIVSIEHNWKTEDQAV